MLFGFFGWQAGWSLSCLDRFEDIDWLDDGEQLQSPLEYNFSRIEDSCDTSYSLSGSSCMENPAASVLQGRFLLS